MSVCVIINIFSLTKMKIKFKMAHKLIVIISYLSLKNLTA